MAEQRAEQPRQPQTSTTPPVTSSSSEASEPRRPSGKKYRLAAGLTYQSGIATEGQVVDEEELGPGFNPLPEEKQLEKWGRVLYTEHKEGKQEAEEPEEEQGEVTDPSKLKDLSDEDLLKTAQAMGIHYPAGTDRKIVEGAVRKRMERQEEKLAEAEKESQ